MNAINLQSYICPCVNNMLNDYYDTHPFIDLHFQMLTQKTESNLLLSVYILLNKLTNIR